jgi:hypothetical protein
MLLPRMGLYLGLTCLAGPLHSDAQDEREQIVTSY